MMDKMPAPWRGVQLLLQLGGVPLELFAALISNYLFSTSSTDLLANSEMFTASTNTRNFKFVVILKNDVCALRRICLQDAGYVRYAKDGQEH